MKKVLFWGILVAMSLQNGYAETTSDSVNVTLQNARRTIGYKGALVVDGKTVTLKNKTLTATGGNEIAVLVVNGGKLVLDHCTIQKTGDGIRSGGNGLQRQEGRPAMNGQQRQEERPAMNGQRGQGRSGRPGGGGQEHHHD